MTHEDIHPAFAEEMQSIITMLIKSVEVFAGLTQEEMQTLLRDAHQCAFGAGDIIIREGAAGSSLYVVYSGNVQVVKGASEEDYVELARLGPAECFGEMSLVDNQCRSADIVACDECTLFRIDADDLWRHAGISAKIFRNIARILAYRLRETNVMARWWKNT